MARIDPRARLVFILMLITTISLLPDGDWWLVALIWMTLTGLSAFAGLGPFHILRRSYIALPFALAALTLPFTTPGDAVASLPVVGWTLSLQGVIKGLSLLLRAWLAVQAALLLISTTPVESILWSMGALRVPGILVAVVGFANRYLALLLDEARRMIRARTARSAPVAGRHPAMLWQSRAAGAMAGSLFLRSLERSERVYAAMLARGYDGRIRIEQSPRMQTTDWLILLAGACALAGMLWLGWR